MLWHCWVGLRKSIWTVKNWVMRCWHGYLSAARCMIAYRPADGTVTPLSLASLKSRMALPFWCRLSQVVLEKRPSVFFHYFFCCGSMQWTGVEGWLTPALWHVTHCYHITSYCTLPIALQPLVNIHVEATAANLHDGYWRFPVSLRLWEKIQIDSTRRKHIRME